jgi:predicted MFS family arabinose efflux permease
VTSKQGQLRQYALVTANYWTFTLTDGALRMLILLYFYELGYSPLDIALLFIFYEVFGVITNLLGGWLGARIGLNNTMNFGLLLQIVALLLLLVPQATLTVMWVMVVQALSGIAKDLNKMSAKSAIKLLVPAHENARLFRWVALLTGSKNTLKGVGFFLGGLLLSLLGFRGAILLMAVTLLVVWLISLVKLRAGLGRSKEKPKFRALFSKSRTINFLSAARMFLFASRDVWFVIALPVFLARDFAWSHTFIGGFLALWIILYGMIQAMAPKLINQEKLAIASGSSASNWAMLLAMIMFAIVLALFFGWPTQPVIIGGLFIFGVAFAINSSLHSYLIVHYATADGVSLDVGFYYMANALGRLLGTILSGLIFQYYGLQACLLVSGVLILTAAFLSKGIDRGL